MTQPSSSDWQSITTSDNSVTIPVNDTVSNAKDLQGTFLCALNIPSTFDGSQLQFLVSNDGENFRAYRNVLNQLYTITVTAGDAVGIFPADFAMWRYIKLVSVTTQTTTSTIIGLVTRPIV